MRSFIMRVALLSSILVSVAAFSAVTPESLESSPPTTVVANQYTIPGAVAPLGTFDPLHFADRADEATLKRYREAELQHGRVAMLAAVGFLAGEAVQSAWWGGRITGPAIRHIPQLSPILWLFLTVAIAKAEITRAEIGWVEPSNVPYDRPGLLRENYIPGDLGFDPLGLKPTDAAGYWKMQVRELQNGRLAMIAASGFMAQELTNGKGILENLA